MPNVPSAEWLQRHAADIVETLHEPMVVLDSRGCIVWANESFFRVFGLTAAEVTGQPILEFPGGVFSSLEFADLIERIWTEQAFVRNQQVELHVKSGGPRALLVNGRRLFPADDAKPDARRDGGKRDGNGSPSSHVDAPAILLTMFDRTQQLRVNAQQARLAALVDSSSDAIIAHTFDGIILDWNAGAERIYGYTAAEAVGQPVSIIVPSELMDETRALYEQMRRGKPVQDRESIRVHKDGRRFAISLTMSPIRDSQQRTVLISTIERDVSRRVRRERELRQAKEEAERATRLQGEFLANVSHELRTPMNAIIGMTDLALDEDLDATVRDYLQTVRTSAGVLMDLLNDVLDFSKLESGNFEIEEVPFLIDDVIQASLKSISLPAYEKGLELIGDVDERVPSRLLGDPLRLRQVLLNLLSNAIKFTEAGEVELRVTRVSQSKRHTRLRFDVRDTGIGIPPEQQSEIFAPFRQADASSTRVHGGSGLGLAIVTQLVDLMGGHVTLWSEEGHGSTFSFSAEFGIPDASPTEPAVESRPVQQMQGLPVLIVDDNQTNRDYLKRVLQNWSLKPETVRSGREAVALMKERAAAGQPFPLVILDALMPEMDGFSVAETIGTDPEIARATLLMLSSADRQVFRDRLENLPVDAFLEKPVSQSDLWDTIASSLGGLAMQSAAVPAPRMQSRTPRRLRILLAEDMPANQKVVVRILEKRGHSVTVAGNGRMTLDVLTENPSGFDLILMDVQMPIMDGYQTTTAIRQLSDEAARRMPVIAMTAHAMRGDREKCLAAGMDGYLSKPVDARKLIALVEGYAFRDAGGERAAQDSSTEGQFDVIQILDLEAALTRLGGDQSLLDDMLGFFVEDVPPLLTELQQNLQDRNAEKLERTAHSLKGLLSNFDGRGTAVEMAERLQQCGQTGDFNEASALVPRLQRRSRRLLDAARQCLEMQ